jgi:hypothetical protein
MALRVVTRAPVAMVVTPASVARVHSMVSVATAETRVSPVTVLPVRPALMARRAIRMELRAVTVVRAAMARPVVVVVPVAARWSMAPPAMAVTVVPVVWVVTAGMPPLIWALLRAPRVVMPVPAVTAGPVVWLAMPLRSPVTVALAVTRVWPATVPPVAPVWMARPGFQTAAPVVSVVPAVTARPVAWVVSARCPVSTGWPPMAVTVVSAVWVVTAGMPPLIWALLQAPRVVMPAPVVMAGPVVWLVVRARSTVPAVMVAMRVWPVTVRPARPALMARRAIRMELRAATVVRAAMARPVVSVVPVAARWSMAPPAMAVTAVPVA